MSQYGYATNNELFHHGIKGQKWGVRRYQNEDGSLTAAGRARYGVSYTSKNPIKRLKSAAAMKGQANYYKDVKKYVKKSNPKGLSNDSINQKVKEYYYKNNQSDIYDRDKAAYNYTKNVKNFARGGGGAGMSVGIALKSGIDEGVIDSPIEMPYSAAGGIGGFVGSLLGSIGGHFTSLKDYNTWKSETDRIVDDMIKLNRRDFSIKGQKEPIVIEGFDDNNNFNLNKLTKSYLDNLISNSPEGSIKKADNYYKVSYDKNKNEIHLYANTMMNTKEAGPMGQPVEYIYDATTKKFKDSNWI